MNEQADQNKTSNSDSLERGVKCVLCEKQKLKTEELKRALRLAQTSLEQGQNTRGRLAANGPTIGEVIHKALNT